MNVVIDGRLYEAERGETILELCRRNGIHIPTLCHSDALPGQGNCRLCIVEVIENKKSRVVASCIFPLTREVEVLTSSEKIKRIRRTEISLLSLKAPDDRYLKELKEEYGAREPERLSASKGDNCILCGLCVRACEEMGTCAISTVNRGVYKKVSTPFDEPSDACIGCGACAMACPTRFIKIREADGVRTIWDKDFHLVKCTACGKYTVTEEQLKLLQGKLGLDSNDFLCSECRRKHEAQKFKEIYEGYLK